MLDKTGRLHIVGMGNHKFLILCRRGNVFFKFCGTQRTVTERHRHSLAFALTENQTIATGELRRAGCRTGKLIDHLALSHLYAAQRYQTAEFRHVQLNFNFTDADFTHERMRATITALCGVTQRQQEAFITAC